MPMTGPCESPDTGVVNSMMANSGAGDSLGRVVPRACGGTLPRPIDTGSVVQPPLRQIDADSLVGATTEPTIDKAAAAPPAY